MKNITVKIPQEQKEFLGLIIHQDGAGNLSEAVQWCIDSCMRIEKNYGDDGGQYDACYVAFHDIREKGHPRFGESRIAVSSEPKIEDLEYELALMKEQAHKWQCEYLHKNGEYNRAIEEIERLKGTVSSEVSQLKTTSNEE